MHGSQKANITKEQIATRLNVSRFNDADEMSACALLEISHFLSTHIMLNSTNPSTIPNTIEFWLGEKTWIIGQPEPPEPAAIYPLAITTQAEMKAETAANITMVDQCNLTLFDSRRNAAPTSQSPITKTRQHASSLKHGKMPVSYMG